MPDAAVTPDLRRRILDATRRLLITDGYANLSMRKIARTLGHSATSIYLHFEGKDALFHALIDEGMERLYQTLSAVPEEPDAAHHLGGLCRAYIDFGLENAEYYEIMFMLHPERMARYPADKYRRARRSLDVISAALQRGDQTGRFVVDQPRVTASPIWAMLHGAVSLRLARRVDIRIDEDAFTDTVVEQILRSVSPHSTDVARIAGSASL